MPTIVPYLVRNFTPDSGVERYQLVAMSKVPTSAGVVAAMIVLGVSLDASAQPTTYVHPTVIVRDGLLRIDVHEEPWPLHAALRELQQKHGCPATHEDPPLEHADDLIESVVAKTGYRYVVPRGGALSLSHPFSLPGDPEEFEGAVRALVRAHEDHGLPGRFRVVREGTIVHVIPTEVRSKAGIPVAVKPLMDAPVVFAARDWANVQGIEAVVAAVRAATGAPIKVGQWPLNVLMPHRAHVGADNEPARTVLGRLMMTPYTAVSWSVFRDFTRHEFLFHVQSVPSSNPRDPTRPACLHQLPEPR